MEMQQVYSPQASLRIALLSLLLIVFWMVSGSWGWSQSDQYPSGTLTGVVINLGSGGPVTGVLVTLDELGLTAQTDLDGIYQMRVPVGTYQLTVEHQGFLSQTIRGVKVEAGKSNYQDVALNPREMDLGRVTVVAEAEEATQAAMLAERRSSAVISDGIGAQEMSRTTGSDATDAIQRVTGVSIVDNRFVFIRGLGERYSSTMLNGSLLPTTQPDKKVVPLDLFPTSLLQSIQTEKSYTPDKPAEFSGGLVKLESISFPRQPTLRLGISQGFGTLTTFKDLMTYPGGGRDFFGFDDGTRALPSVIPSERVIRGSRFSSGGFTTDQLQAFGLAFSNNWDTELKEAIPDQKFNFVAGNTFGKLGVVFAATHANSFRNRNETQTIYSVGSGGIEPFHDYDFQYSTASVRTGATLNLGWEFSGTQRVFFKQFYSHDSTDEARIFEGFNGDAKSQLRDIRLRFQEEAIYSAQVSGEHTLPVFGNSLLEWRLSRARSTLDDPDLREVLYEYNPSIQSYVLADESQSGFRQFTHLAEELWEPALDFSTFFNRGSLVGSIKVGGSYRTRGRDFGSRRFRFVPRGRQGIDITLTPNEIFTPENIRPTGFELREETRPTDTYEATEITRSGYAMADLSWGRWRFIGGMRVESDSQVLTTFDLFNRRVNTTVETRLHNTDWLPAMNAVYSLGGKMNLRGSFSQTLNRPEFRELSSFDFTDVVGGRSVVGNPDLRRALIDNFDVRWEWFPEPEELISVSFFYKDFTDPIERVIEPTAQLRTSFVNAQGASNFGIEADFRRSLGFLADSLASMSVSANYTYVDSEVDIAPDALNVLTSLRRPLAGQSAHVINLAYQYQHPRRGFLARLLLNYQGRRITDVGALGLPDIYEEGYPRLDFLFAQPLGESAHWNLKFSAENLLDRATRFTQGGQPFRTFETGRVFSVNVAYSFF